MNLFIIKLHYKVLIALNHYPKCVMEVEITNQFADLKYLTK